MPEEKKGLPTPVAIAFVLAGLLGGAYALTQMVKAKPPTPPPGKANLYGVIKDASTGNRLPDVLVTLNGYSALTNPSGYYEFLDLEPGNYVVQFSKEGYETLAHDIVLVESNNELNVAMVPIPVVPLEIISLKVNGSPQPSVSPRTVLAAELQVRAYQDISLGDALITFGRVYDKGSEPQPKPCPPPEEAPFGCSEAVLPFIDLGDKLFLPMPVLGLYDLIDDRWNMVYWDGHSELIGTMFRPHWFWSSGTNAYQYPFSQLSLTPGERALDFVTSGSPLLPPDRKRPGVKVSDTIRGSFDALVRLNSYWAVFRCLTVGTSPDNPDQLTIAQWIDKITEPYIYSGPL